MCLGAGCHPLPLPLPCHGVELDPVPTRTCAGEGSTFSGSAERQLCCLSPGLPAATKELRAGVQAPTLSKQFPVTPINGMCQHQPSTRCLGQRESWWQSGSPARSPACGEGCLQHRGSDGQEWGVLLGHTGRQVPAQSCPVGQVRRGQQDTGEPVPVGREARWQQKAEVLVLFSSVELSLCWQHP